MTQDMISKPFWGNDVEIDTATATITGAGTSLTFELGLSPNIDGVYTYEEVTSGVKHTFTANGKWIRWKATGTNFTITNIQVQINT